MKFLKERYKTVEGARKRCAFENGLAKGEFERGYKAKHYHYTVQQDETGQYRVVRNDPKPAAPVAQPATSWPTYAPSK